MLGRKQDKRKPSMLAGLQVLQAPLWPHCMIQEEQRDNRDKVLGGRGGQGGFVNSPGGGGVGAQSFWKVTDQAGLLRHASVSLALAATKMVVIWGGGGGVVVQKGGRWLT